MKYHVNVTCTFKIYIKDDKRNILDLLIQYVSSFAFYL